MLSSIVAIATICVLIPFFACIPIALVGGSRKTLHYSIGRIACLVLAVILATYLVCLTPLGNVTSDAVFDLLGDDPEELFPGSDAVEVMVDAMIRAFTAPVVFSLCFVVLFLIMRLILLVVFSSMKLRRKKHDSFVRNPGTWLGLVHGLLLALVLTAPLCGYLATALDAVAAFKDTDVLRTSIL